MKTDLVECSAFPMPVQRLKQQHLQTATDQQGAKLGKEKVQGLAQGPAQKQKLCLMGETRVQGQCTQPNTAFCNEDA